MWEKGEIESVKTEVLACVVLSTLFIARLYMAAQMPLKNKLREYTEIKTQVWVLLWLVFSVAFILQWTFTFGYLARTIINVDIFLFVCQFVTYL